MTKMVSDLEYDAVTAKKAKVKVTATSLGSAPWVCFTMDADYPEKGGKQAGDELEFDARAGPFDVSFELDDETDLDLAFYPDFTDAMWVVVGLACPTQPGNGNGAIIPISVADKKLVVTNQNAVGQTLTFMLRFTGNSSGADYPPYEYDPRIINGGDPPLTESAHDQSEGQGD